MSGRYEFYTGGVPRQGRFGPNSPLPPRRRPEGAIGDATLRWGGPSNFQISSNAGGASQPIHIILPSADDADDESLGLIYTEIERQTTTVRVSNPLDANDFVDVERIDQISFRGPDDRIRTFVLNN